MKTKIFTLSIASLAILSLLVACGPKEQASTQPSAQQSSTQVLLPVLVNHRRLQARTLLRQLNRLILMVPILEKMRTTRSLLL